MQTDAHAQKEKFSQILERFAKLTPHGMTDFFRRLIVTGQGHPPIQLELERVLERLETDANLKICWQAGGAPVTPVVPELAAA